jgi:hypothetical protein
LINASEIGLEGGGMLASCEAPSRYRSLVLVAHSEGGIVVRYLMTRALDVFENRAARAASPPSASPHESNSGSPLGDPNEASLLLNAKLRLFAPATGGYRPAGIKGVLATMPFLGQVCAALLHYSPAFLDMDPKELTTLRDRTQEGAKAHPHLEGLRASILWGEDEKLVKADWFAADNVAIVPDKNHMSVCKPHSNYMMPLEFVCA